MFIPALQKYIEEQLTAQGWDGQEAAATARILLAHKLDISLSHLPLMHKMQLEIADISPELARLAAGEPLQYVIGETEFMGLVLYCRPSALIPRGDSEAVAEAAIELMKNAESPCIADICTGSGAYALALADALPKSHIDAVDISADALDLAENNAARLGLTERIHFYQGDLLEPLLRLGQSYDMLVSNPPYIPSDQLAHLDKQVQHEPAIALDGGADGLYFYRRLAADAGKLLKSGGWLVVEHGCDQAADVSRIMAGGGLETCRVVQDYGGRDRGIICRKQY